MFIFLLNRGICTFSFGLSEKDRKSTWLRPKSIRWFQVCLAPYVEFLFLRGTFRWTLSRPTPVPRDVKFSATVQKQTSYRSEGEFTQQPDTLLLCNQPLHCNPLHRCRCCTRLLFFDSHTPCHAKTKVLFAVWVALVFERCWNHPSSTSLYLSLCARVRCEQRSICSAYFRINFRKIPPPFVSFGLKQPFNQPARSGC